MGLQGCHGRGPRGFRHSSEFSRADPGSTTHTPAAVSPKHKPTFPSPTLPPLPSCSNRQGHWLEKPRPQPCPSGLVGGGAPACPLPPPLLPPFLLLQPVIHFPLPTARAAGCEGMLTCSGRLSAAGDPRCSPLVPTCYILQAKKEEVYGVKKGGGEGVLGNDIRPYVAS